MKNSKITLYLYLQVGKGSKNDVSYVGCIGSDSHKNSVTSYVGYVGSNKGRDDIISCVGCIGDDVNGFFNASNLAAMEGHLDILNILIDSGANIEWQHTLVIMSIDRFSHRGFRYKISIKSSNFIFLTKFKLVLSIMVVKLVWM